MLIVGNKHSLLQNRYNVFIVKYSFPLMFMSAEIYKYIPGTTVPWTADRGKTRKRRERGSAADVAANDAIAARMLRDRTASSRASRAVSRAVARTIEPTTKDHKFT